MNLANNLLNYSISDQLVACHEIGHAITDHRLGIGFIFVTANIKGHDCTVTPSAEGIALCRERPHLKVLSALGGPAGEVAMARVLTPGFDFPTYSARKWLLGWSKDRRMAEEVGRGLRPRFPDLILEMADLLHNAVTEIGEELVPILLGRGRSVPAKEVLAVFDRHESVLAEVDLDPLVQAVQRHSTT